MLVINAEGVIHDVPDEVMKEYTFNRWGSKKAEVLEMFSALEKLISESSDSAQEPDVEGQGCCNAFPNWCPPNETMSTEY